MRHNKKMGLYWSYKQKPRDAVNPELEEGKNLTEMLQGMLKSL